MTAAPPARAEALPRLGLVLLALLSLAWGINWPIMKVVLAEVPPWTFRALCALGGAAGLFTLCRVAGIPLALPRDKRLVLAVVALFNVTGWVLLSALGVSVMAAGRASVIAFTMPVWVVLLGALFLGERLTPRRVTALGLGLAGLAVLIGPDFAAVGRAPVGALYMCGAAVSWAVGTVIIKRVVWNAPVVALTAWQLTIGGIPVALGALAWEAGGLAPVGPGAALAVAYNVFVCFTFGPYAWFKIITLFPAAIAGIGSLMIPVIGVFSSALLLGEPLGFQELGGLALVVAALASVLAAPRRAVT